jgi:hypothetical protein
MRLSRVILRGKSWRARCQPTRRGVRETFWPRLKYEAWGCRVPSIGPGCASYWPPFVSLHGARFGYNYRIPWCSRRVVRGVGVACKHVFTVPFYCIYKGSPLCLLGCYTVGLWSWQSPLHESTPSRTTSHCLLASFPAAEKKERKRN